MNTRMEEEEGVCTTEFNFINTKRKHCTIQRLPKGFIVTLQSQEFRAKEHKVRTTFSVALKLEVGWKRKVFTRYLNYYSLKIFLRF